MDDSDLAAVVVAQLGGRSLATAESCTAGRVGQAFAAVGRALEWFRGGVIAGPLGALTGPERASLG